MAAPDPRTWSEGDLITVPRLRGDMTNLASLFMTGRPMLLAQLYINPGLIANTNLALDLNDGLAYLNTWNVPLGTVGGSNSLYQIPLAGWWLASGAALVDAPSSPGADRYGFGFSTVVNGSGPGTMDGGCVPGSVASSEIGPTGMDLYQFNTYAATSDTLAWYAFCSANAVLFTAYMNAEWVALPTSGLTDYTGPYGTVVSSPSAAAAWPPGPGTYITSSGGIAAGATSLTVHDTTGIIDGGTLGLDYIASQPAQAYAETVTVSGVTGSTVSISAASYAHSQNAPVAVPVSAAFLNQQCRDVVNFLAYPPVLRAISSTTQSIASSSFPPTVSGNPTNKITTLGSTTVDNFSGFSGSGTYTVPVAGVYLVYGQVYYTGTTSVCNYGAGISVSGGTIQWGNVIRSDTSGGAETFCANVTKHLRLTAGQTITLWAYQDSGSAMATISAGPSRSRLICIFRSF
jgi:hypothetical protein